MRTVVAATVCLALAACDMTQPSPATSEGTPTPDAVATPSAGMAGTYQVTLDDGTVMMSALNADGTYVDSAEGKEMERGTWRSDGDQTCFDPEGDRPEECHASSEAEADGSFRLLDATGQEIGVTVRKVGETADPVKSAPDPVATPKA